MENEREALARVLYERKRPLRNFDSLPPKAQDDYREEAEAAIAAGWRKVDAPTKREWPVTAEALKAYEDADIGNNLGDEFTNGLRAAAPFLWRARVEGMTEQEMGSFLLNLPDTDELDDYEVLRAALLALGDL